MTRACHTDKMIGVSEFFKDFDPLRSGFITSEDIIILNTVEPLNNGHAWDPALVLFGGYIQRYFYPLVGGLSSLDCVLYWKFHYSTLWGSSCHSPFSQINSFVVA